MYQLSSFVQFSSNVVRIWQGWVELDILRKDVAHSCWCPREAKKRRKSGAYSHFKGIQLSLERSTRECQLQCTWVRIRYFLPALGKSWCMYSFGTAHSRCTMTGSYRKWLSRVSQICVDLFNAWSQVLCEPLVPGSYNPLPPVHQEHARKHRRICQQALGRKIYQAIQAFRDVNRLGQTQIVTKS